MKTATVTLDPYAGGFFSTPYDPDYVSSLKAAVPSYARSWNKLTKTWRIDTIHVDTALRVTRQYFRVVITGEAKAEPKVMGQSDWAGELFGVLPAHLHEPAYKALMRVLHPDIGGDTAATQTLTRAYAKRQAA